MLRAVKYPATQADAMARIFNLARAYRDWRGDEWRGEPYAAAVSLALLAKYFCLEPHMKRLEKIFPALPPQTPPTGHTARCKHA